MTSGGLSVVVATRDRADELGRALRELRRLPEQPEVVVVDNASTDTTLAVARAWADRVVEAGANRGAAARNLGVEAASGEIVALADDDSWFAPGALARAAGLLVSAPKVAVLAAAVYVGGAELDPTCAAMAASPLGPPAWAPASGRDDVRLVLGFLACGAVLRRSAFLEAGGFAPWLHIGAEEELLALDLASAGWELVYDPTVVAYHFPSGRREWARRRRLQVRNSLWVAWLRASPATALRRTWSYCRSAASRPGTLGGLAAAMAGWPGVAAHRRRVPPHVEGWLRALEASPRSRPAGP